MMNLENEYDYNLSELENSRVGLKCPEYLKLLKGSVGHK